ncbi:hypothetical protein ACU4HD_46980 [Cupriavidus basilensis]
MRLAILFMTDEAAAVEISRPASWRWTAGVDAPPRQAGGKIERESRAVDTNTSAQQPIIESFHPRPTPSGPLMMAGASIEGTEDHEARTTDLRFCCTPMPPSRTAVFLRVNPHEACLQQQKLQPLGKSEGAVMRGFSASIVRLP